MDHECIYIDHVNTCIDHAIYYRFNACTYINTNTAELDEMVEDISTKKADVSSVVTIKLNQICTFLMTTTFVLNSLI